MNPRVGILDRVVVTHNFCDPTTWFSESTRVTDESAIDSGDGLTWNLANSNVIDLTHGKVHDEDNTVTAVGHGYSVDVTVDAVPMTQREPFADSGGDYTVNYSAGTITFASDQSGSTVLVSYSYANGSAFHLRPNTGTRLDIEYAEVQFSLDVEMTSDFQMIIQGFVEVFAPSLAVSNGGPIPDGTRIDLSTYTYKTIDNIIEEAVEAMPSLPVFGTNNRASGARHVFPFKYNSARNLSDAAGLGICLKLGDDKVWGGTRVTVSFYCVEREDM